MRRRVTVLGSTGSIGRQALDVIRRHPERFEVAGLAAGGSSVEVLERQAAEFRPEYVAVRDEVPSVPSGTKLLCGERAAEELAAVPVDVVLNGIVGFAGLAATVSALRAGNRLALANKESLVAGGEWVMSLAGEGQIIPVDSEHSAIFQCLEGGGGLAGVLLTASGGPFFELEKRDLLEVGPEDALKHPNWEMGARVTVDSATMMNKGLEVIEAHHLFGVPYDDIKVAVHRQSIVHGGVMLKDGSVILHAALPDMRIPIAYGLSHPERVETGVETVPFDAVWTFQEPRDEIFRCLPLALEAGRAGGAYPIALNAADEVAVAAFLEKRIAFLEIADIIEGVLERIPAAGRPDSMEAITAVDRAARELAEREVSHR
ncbi:1-deoxy-D-xylulose-5-phosphate reductoisomerase [Rubrobacter taiwanensis]|uniref:1-deoxy-D-xylulose 5-phosphate reductoisomerase n=1 Tax=Rubrobacter taiwanensis TaxID=185139 RepID=A0A4R1BHI1_9ACTN|nr:1-deoxy-D-xylulose-5-phosphate reductoisomerase [Rubrobacter taiwanensis]